MNTSKAMNAGIMIMAIAILLSGCGTSNSKLQEAAATSIAATKVFEGAISTAIALTQESHSTPTLLPTPTMTPISTITPTPTKASTLPNWEFNNDGDSEGWGANDYDIGNLENITVEDGLFRADATGDTMLYNRYVRFAADRVNQIEILMRVSAGQSAALFFETEKSGDMSEATGFRFRIQPGDKFMLYKVNVSSNINWEGIVTTLRIDPMVGGIGKIEIDYIRVIPFP